MTGLLPSLFRFFLSWWGVFLLGALDSTMIFFVPLGIDAVVMYLAAQEEQLFWIVPLLATAGSTAGAALTFWIGRTAGEAGLERFVPARRLARLQKRVRESGAVAIVVPALLPPPFPLTPFVLTCGALAVDRWRFFITFVAARLVRFGVEALLARRYGRGILRLFESSTFQWAIAGFIVLALAGTIVSGIFLWRGTRDRPLRAV